MAVQNIWVPAYPTSRRYLDLIVNTGLAVLLFGPSRGTAQSLDSAQSFAVVGGSAVTAAGSGSLISGDVGVAPGTLMTGFPTAATVVPPFATHNNDGPAAAAQASVSALYAALAPGACASPTLSELDLATFTPGTYCFTSTAHLATGGTLTLNGAGTYIFQIGSSITAETGSNVLLIGGADACQVFWQVTAAATLSGATFAGNVVAQTAITLGINAPLMGRALTTAAGAVTVSGGNLIGGCSTAPALETPTATLTVTPIPTATTTHTAGVTSTHTPPSAPTATQTEIVTPTLSATSAPTLTATATATNTTTSIASGVPTSSHTRTPSPSDTATWTPASAISTSTASPPTPTATATATRAPLAMAGACGGARSLRLMWSANRPDEVQLQWSATKCPAPPGCYRPTNNGSVIQAPLGIALSDAAGRTIATLLPGAPLIQGKGCPGGVDAFCNAQSLGGHGDRMSFVYGRNGLTTLRAKLHVRLTTAGFPTLQSPIDVSVTDASGYAAFTRFFMCTTRTTSKVVSVQCR